MSDAESTTVARDAYVDLPILSEDNFADWDMQIVAYLTGSQGPRPDHHNICPSFRRFLS